MGPDNNDPSAAHPEGGIPLSRKELRAMERDRLPESALPALPSQPPTAGAEPSTDELHAEEYKADDLHAEDPHTDELYADEGSAGEEYFDETQHEEVLPQQHLASEGQMTEEHGFLPAEAVVLPSGPSPKARRRRGIWALLIALAVIVVAIVVGVQFLRPLFGLDAVKDYPGPGSGSETIEVQQGAGPRQVATALKDAGVIADAETFLDEFNNAGATLSPGNFQFKKEMKASDAVAVLQDKNAGKVFYFALNAGLRINESLAAISKGTGFSVAELQKLSNAPAQFGVPAKAKNLEGFLMPGEYRFPLDTTAKAVLQKLVTSTLEELKSQGVTDPQKQYDIVTIASILQAEGGKADYPTVAGAIYNRLKPNDQTNGFIQSDATVTYGLGRKSYELTPEEKADKSNLYNTYAHTGLPVGPIGSPGKSALDAAAKPDSNDYLYWVTVNLDTGETKFAKTLEEHNGYVSQYTAWCEAHAGRCS
ncbi:endolytic transglycosylase MltG [Pseudarthrobacter sp. J1738]|uniref:endolytic transglycosylase MltG n=1 Tax=Pseudarthrobacter sp. J1738 TaxID=3420446 RepID=UPI003D2AE8F0